jgi:S1-C subfamily serine protease
VFRQSTLVLDYAHQRIYFAPGGLRDRSGLVLAARGRDIIVAAVHRGAPASASGIAAGMRLTTIDGRPVNAPNDRFAELRLTPRAPRYGAFTFRRESQTR